MYKKIVWIVALISSLALSQSVLADSGICGESIKKMVSSLLNLSEDQKTKIKPILEQLKSTLSEKRTQLDDLSKQFAQQEQSASMDQSTVNNLVDQKTKLIGDIIKAKITARNQISNILNDQQKAQLQKMVSKAEEKIVEKFKQCHNEE